MITDSRRLNAQARRFDGRNWTHIEDKKAWTLPGSVGATPIGLREAQDFKSIVFVEGGPDLLAAFHLMWCSGTPDLGVVAMLGASNRIPESELAAFKGKRVRIFAHLDDEGLKAEGRWWRQLKEAGAIVDGFDFSGLVRSDGQPVGDLNDFCLVDADQWEAERETIEEAFTFQLKERINEKTRVKTEPSQPDDGNNGERNKEDLRKEIFEALKKGAVKGAAFRKLKIKPRKKLLGDWFREGDTGFIFSRRGVGKTWIAWAIARALATGERLGPWEAGEEAVTVCYLDGEMPAELMQQREISFGDECENLTLINHEILFELTGVVLNLRLPEVQQAITQFCVDTGQKVLVVDNLSTLVSGVKENDSDAWELLLPWLLDLRRRKIAVILVHHAGRSGEMRGTSRREDSVFWIIKLEEDSRLHRQGVQLHPALRQGAQLAAEPLQPLHLDVQALSGSYDNPSGNIEITFKTASLKSWSMT